MGMTVERTKLYTIGYEKRDLAEFLDILMENEVEIIIDIRAVPYSRRKEYSKKILAASLTQAGIEYVHIVELGSPKELRDKVKADDDYDYFFAEYEKYLQTQTEALRRIVNIAGEKNSCLLCYERDVDRCHRRAVADGIRDMAGENIGISHL